MALYPPAGALRELPRRTGSEHVTLAFLGQVADPAPLGRALVGVEAVPAPVVQLRGSGRFRGGAVWLAVHGDLTALRSAVVAAILSCGLPPPPGPWHPHLTVGRGHVPAEVLAFRSPPAPWPEVALVRSTLTPAGAVHEPLARWRLGVPS